MGLLLINSLWFISLACAAFLVYSLFRFGSRDKRLPPGPPTLPILGNAHLIPSSNLHLKLKEWSDTYGAVFSLKIGADTFIVLNDRRAIHELLDKRSAIYSERPLDHNSELCFQHENIAFMHSTPLWRAQRKIASQNLSPRVLDEKIGPIQEAEICQLVHDLLVEPDKFFEHTQRVTASVASIALLGHRAPTYESFWARAVDKAMHRINPALEPGSYLPIEQFPILKYIPDRWASSTKRAKICFAEVLKIWTEARETVVERRKNGDLRESLLDRILAGEVKFDVPLTDDQLSNFLGAVTQGAADTTMSAILSGVLLLAKNPHVQEKAFAELDRVCGTERMPAWTDFKDLPYINCIVKEGLRVSPVLRAGVPHRVNRDDWYDGMLIPKNATIFFPAWTAHQTFYENAQTYNPDRYLNHPRLAMDYAGSPDYENRDHYAYGSGRRICVGIHLAERTQWRILARLLWAFKIEPAIDENTGKPIELDTSEDGFTNGFITAPLPYRVNFVPRSEKHVEVIRHDFENVKEYLRRWE